MDSQCTLTIGRLRAEVRELQTQNAYLKSEVDTLQTILHVAEITKIFDSVAPGCVYHRYFNGAYRQQILTEIIARYCSTQTSNHDYISMELSQNKSTVDAKRIAHIMRAVGNECRDGILKTSFGSTISFDGG